MTLHIIASGASSVFVEVILTRLSPAHASRGAANDMPAYRRHDRGEEWWVYFRFRGRRVRRRSPIQTRKGTEEFERALLRELGDDLAAGRDPFIGPPPTLGEFVPRWMTDYVAPRNRPATQYQKACILKTHILPALANYRLDRITTRELDQLSASLLRQGIGGKYVKTTVSVLRCALSTAADWGMIRSVPKVHWPRVPTPEITFLSPDEATRLAAAMPTPFWRAFVTLLVTTGLRFGEAAALTWKDVNLDDPNPCIHVARAVNRSVIDETKTGRRRVVPLIPATVEALLALDRSREQLFTREDGSFMRPDHVAPILHRACRDAGIKRIGWHALRHTFATTLVSRGAPLRIVQELLGHTTIQMTCRYAHAAPSTLREYMRYAHLATPEHASVHQVSTKPENAALPPPVEEGALAKPTQKAAA
ncbi:MAG: site-specific integrase [Polyangiaceae bacterium]